MPLTFEQELMAAVWMVGNMDTEEDKAAWWATFRDTWEKCGAVRPDIQKWADEMAQKKYDETR